MNSFDNNNNNNNNDFDSFVSYEDLQFNQNKQNFDIQPDYSNSNNGFNQSNYNKTNNGSGLKALVIFTFIVCVFFTVLIYKHHARYVEEYEQNEIYRSELSMLKAENEAEKLKLEEIQRMEKEKFEEEENQRMEEEKRKLTALSEATNPDLPTQLEEPVPTNPALPKPDPAKIKSELTDANEKAKVCGTSGSLNISFSLSPDGIIKDLKSIGGTFKDTPTESCILRVYQEHEFPKFSGSSIVVKYTVKL